MKSLADRCEAKSLALKIFPIETRSCWQRLQSKGAAQILHSQLQMEVRIVEMLPFFKIWVHSHAIVMVVSLCGINISFLNYPIHLICRVEDFMKSDVAAVLVRQ